jgi:hypothetical protein
VGQGRERARWPAERVAVGQARWPAPPVRAEQGAEEEGWPAAPALAGLVVGLTPALAPAPPDAEVRGRAAEGRVEARESPS